MPIFRTVTGPSGPKPDQIAPETPAKRESAPEPAEIVAVAAEDAPETAVSEPKTTATKRPARRARQAKPTPETDGSEPETAPTDNED